MTATRPEDWESLITDRRDGRICKPLPAPPPLPPRLRELRRQGRHLAVAWANGRRGEVYEELEKIDTRIDAIVVGLALFCDLSEIAGTDPSGFLEAIEARASKAPSTT